MEKRRLLLVVMLLATSGAVLASGDEKDSAAPSTDGAKVEEKSVSVGRGKRAWKFVRRTVTWPARKLARTPKTPVCCETELTDATNLTVPEQKELVQNIKEWKRFARRVHGCVTVVLAVALYKTAKNKKVQEGVKGLIRGVRRTLSRKKAPENRTDGKAIEA